MIRTIRDMRQLSMEFIQPIRRLGDDAPIVWANQWKIAFGNESVTIPARVECDSPQFAMQRAHDAAIAGGLYDLAGAIEKTGALGTGHHPWLG